MLPSVESSQPGTKIGRSRLDRRDHPAVVADRSGRCSLELAARAARDRRTRAGSSARRRVGGAPLLDHDLLDAAHRLCFRNARVGHAVEMPLEQRLFVVRRQLAIVRHALVVVVRHEVEDVFFEVGAGAADRVDLVAANHLGQRHARARRCSSRRPASRTSCRPGRGDAA